jgi:predicted nucleic acid-binding protein
VVGSLLYLDASAIVRLVLEEPGWEALAAHLRGHPHRVTSLLSGVEVRRAIRRAGPSPERITRATSVLNRLDQVALSADLLSRAGEIEPATVRTLDAIHLATALELRPVDGFVTYDVRLASAAALHGFRVDAPESV